MKIVSIFLTFVLFVYALRVENKYHKKLLSWASIVPIVWFFISFSRPFSRWLGIGHYKMTRDISYVDMLEKGNFTDQIFYLTILLIAAIILFKRRALVSHIFRENKLWLLFILYCMISILWSDFAFVSIKRFFKDLNSYLIILIILTEKNPEELFKSIIRKISFLFIPLSIAFCKFFPDLGRYQTSSWNYIYTGVTTHKNGLGVLCLISILIMFIDIWPYILKRQIKINKQVFFIYCFYCSLALYLMYLANSMTSNICLLISLSIFISKTLKKHLTKLIISIIIIYATGLDEYIINSLQSTFLGIVERDASLSGRTELWDAIFHISFNKIIGTGYSSFWLGDRMKELIQRFIFIPKQAHNGYIEIYINLGFIGLSILIAALLQTYKKIVNYWNEHNYQLSFQLAFFTTFLIYNMTEAAILFNLSVMWQCFLFIALSNKKLMIKGSI